VPVVAVLFLGLVALVNILSGHFVVGLLLAALAYLWTTWIAEIEPPSPSELAGGLGRAVKAVATSLRPRRPRRKESSQGVSGPPPWRQLPGQSVSPAQVDSRDGGGPRGFSPAPPSHRVAQDPGAASGPTIRSTPRRVARAPRTGTAPPLDRPPTGTSPRRRRRRRHSRTGTMWPWRALRH
jgi:hypothetical protein